MLKRLTLKLAVFAAFSIPAAAFAMDEGYAPDAASHDAAVNHGDAGHHAEAAGSGLPQFDPSTFTGQLFWLAVTFAVLYTVFARKTLPAISSTLENRRMHIESDLETASRLRGDAENSQKNYESLLNDARTESTRLMNEAITETKNHAEKKIRELQEKSLREIESVGKKLEDSKRAALDDMTALAAEIASEAAARIVGIKPDITQAQTVVQSLNSKRKAA